MKAQQALAPAFIGAIGVVFGDIGTSPLYAFKESLAAAGYRPGDEAAILGLLSLIFWSLAIVVTVKYLTVIMRADNHGEGGILSLVALIQERYGSIDTWARRAVALGVLGAALFYCDALITPAISVLSAVEGLTVLDPNFERAVLPVTLGVIIALFAIQRRGTARVGRLFGPDHAAMVRDARDSRRHRNRERSARAARPSIPGTRCACSAHIRVSR